MRIAVIGKSGQLARSLQYVSDDSTYELHFIGQSEIDIMSRASVEGRLAMIHPEVLINCAAYTAVDAAEDDPEGAERLNALAVQHLVEVCSALKILLIHVSTDYVFDGTSSKPYREEDHCNPQSVYGHSKRRGELHVLNAETPGVVVRTSWLYSPFGKNFYKTIRQRVESKAFLRVVNDQHGVPTSALDLARALLFIAENHNRIQQPEIFHISNTGPATWFDFALAIAKAINPNHVIEAVDSAAFVTKAKRPAYSVLSTAKLERQLGYTMRPWQEALKEVLELPLQD